MPSQTTIVIGASRGIGLGLAQYLAQDPDHHVIATMRNPFSLEFANVDVIQLDQTDAASVEKAAQNVKEADTLIVNAAIGENEKLANITSEKLGKYFETNVVGAHRVINAFLPALRARKTRKIIFISSTAGSLTKQAAGMWGMKGPYAVSKAAGNMLVVQFHIELKQDGFMVAAICPGWVATDMGNIGGPGAAPVTESVGKVMKIVNSLTVEDSAKFFNVKGEVLPY